MICRVEGCEKILTRKTGCGRGMCAMHYIRATRHPMAKLVRPCADCGRGDMVKQRLRCDPCRDKHKRQLIADWQRRKLYGISRAEFVQKLEAQGGLCAICRRSVSRRYAFDHNHLFDSRDPRGHREILCQPCNVVLGAGKDNPAVLRAAAAYLERHAPRFADLPGEIQYEAVIR